MTTAYTPLLGLALPVTGELAGTWGDEVNNSITQLIEDSLAGVSTFDVTAGNWTLSTTTNGLPNEARTAILIPTGTPGVSRNIVAPSQSKAYIVINQSNAAVVLKGSATTGVTIPAGSTFLCAWNGSDFLKVSENVAGSNTQVQYNNNGVLGASANMTFDGTKLTVAGLKDSALSQNAVVFAGASGELSDDVNFTWDGSTLLVVGAVGITGAVDVTGALSVTEDSEFTSTGALSISKGTTLQRPGTPVVSMIRYNTDSNEFEGYSGSSPAWKSIGGSALSNDTSTSSNLYPVFAAATTGTAQNLYTSNAKYLYKPSTGELSVSAPVASNGLFVNADSVNANYTVATGTNAFSIGPITVATGITVTVASGQRWVVI